MAAVGAIRFHRTLPQPEPLLLITDYYALAQRWSTLDTVDITSLSKHLNRDLWYELHSLCRNVPALDHDTHPNTPIASASPSETYKITVRWSPGHCGLYGNDVADALAKQGCHLAVPKTKWGPEWWRLYHRGAEVTHNYMNLIHNNQPQPLTWPQSVNIRLTFGNLGNRGHVLHLKWMWGYTSWLYTGPHWDYRDPHSCSACAGQHCTDLFSCLAHCPAWQPLRDDVFSCGHPTPNKLRPGTV